MVARTQVSKVNSYVSRIFMHTPSQRDQLRAISKLLLSYNILSVYIIPMIPVCVCVQHQLLDDFNRALYTWMNVMEKPNRFKMKVTSILVTEVMSRNFFSFFFFFTLSHSLSTQGRFYPILVYNFVEQKTFTLQLYENHIDFIQLKRYLTFFFFSKNGKKNFHFYFLE